MITRSSEEALRDLTLSYSEPLRLQALKKIFEPDGQPRF